MGTIAGMNNIETVERLTDIVATQAAIIRDLYGVVQQLNAVTRLNKDLEEIAKTAEMIIKGELIG